MEGGALRRLRIGLLILLGVLACGCGFASDHIDGPITTNNPVTDITDLFVFPTPNTPGSLTLILNVYPFAPRDSHFPERVSYNFLLRKAQISSAAGHPAFQTGEETCLSCQFEAPNGFARYRVACKSSSGLQASSLVNQTSSTGDFRVFAGLRSDPFFFNARWAVKVGTRGVLVPPQKSNSMAGFDVLSIVIDIETNKLLGNSAPSLLAVAATTTAQVDPTAPVRQFDRIGRPEITNIAMVANDGADLRDLYNKEPPFSRPSDASSFLVRLRHNIDFYDRIDGKMEWPEADREALANLLLDDFLVIDLTKPAGPESFFEIERALLEGKDHVTCGGRKPADDVIDTLLTYYINRGRGPMLRDGVDKPDKPISNQFPYLAPPSTGLWARTKAAFARWYFGQ